MILDEPASLTPQRGWPLAQKSGDLYDYEPAAHSRQRWDRACLDEVLGLMAEIRSAWAAIAPAAAGPERAAPGRIARSSRRLQEARTEGVDTVVLYDELACEDVLPVAWSCRRSRATPIGATDDSNLLLLHACVAVEERPVRDKSEESGPLFAELARMELKLNLVLQLLGDIVRRGHPAALARVRFNSVGASWWPQGAPPQHGSRGLLRIQLRGSLPQTLDLSGEVTAVEGGEVKLRFDQVLTHRRADGRLIFRHLRRLADVKKSALLKQATVATFAM
jgi:hypothetical protein